MNTLVFFSNDRSDLPKFEEFYKEHAVSPRLCKYVADDVLPGRLANSTCILHHHIPETFDEALRKSKVAKIIRMPAPTKTKSKATVQDKEG